MNGGVHIAECRKCAGKKQTEMTLSVTDMSRLENGLYNATPEQIKAICADIGCTVDKLYDRERIDYKYPPLKSSVQRREREEAHDIVRLTIRVPAALASRFEAIKGRMTQAEAFEQMVTATEKDRRHQTMASGHKENISTTV